jgi:3-oxoacyl-[acyl-carrier protein] reductase
MRSVAIEYADKGILANSVAPGFIDTKLTSKNNKKETLSKIITQIPTKRLGTPQEVSELVCFLASKKNTYITGQTINIDGGFSIL